MSASTETGSRYQAASSFTTYVAGDCISVASGQMVLLDDDEQVQALVKAGYLVPEQQAKKPTPLRRSRVVSDVVPDPVDITVQEKLGTADVASGRTYEDPSIRRARGDAADAGDSIVQSDSAGETFEDEENPSSDAVQEPVVNDPEGTHTDPKDDGTAAKGSATTGRRDTGKGPKPASKPVKTGQATAHRKPRATGRGKVGGKDPDIAEPDRSTVDVKEPVVEPTGPNRDEPTSEHPSPGTVDLPDSP